MSEKMETCPSRQVNQGVSEGAREGGMTLPISTYSNTRGAARIAAVQSTRR